MNIVRCFCASRPHGRFFVVCAWFFFTLSAQGAVAESCAGDNNQSGVHNDNFHNGNSAFAAKRYAEAAAFFVSALQCDTENNTLRYNLAVSYYKLKEWQQAEKLFAQLVNSDPVNPLYRYNLAVVAKKQNKMSSAKALFVDVASQKDDPRLAVLAEKQLQRIGHVVGHSKQPRHMTRLQLRLAAGQEDGLVDPAEQGIMATEDSFNDVMLFSEYRYRDDSKRRSWFGSLQYQRIDYADLNAYDYDVARLSAGVEQGWDKRRISARLLGEYSHLGDQSYLSAAGLEVNLVQLLDKRPARLQLAYRNFDSLASRFDPLAGSQRLLMFSYDFFNDGGLRWRTAYRVEDNIRNDLSSPFAALDYSPLRQSLHNDVFYRYQKWLFALRLQYRESRYDSENRYINGESDRRIDRRVRADLSASWELSKPMTLQARYVYADSDSNISRYDYRQNIVELALLYRLN